MAREGLAFLLELCGLGLFFFVLVETYLSVIGFVAGMTVLVVFVVAASAALLAEGKEEGPEKPVDASRVWYLLIFFGTLYLGIIGIHFFVDSATGFLASLGGYRVRGEFAIILVVNLLVVTLAIICTAWSVAGFSTKRPKSAAKVAAVTSVLVVMLFVGSVGLVYGLMITQPFLHEPPYAQEELAVQSVNPSENCIYVVNVGKNEMTITEFIVKNQTGTIVATGDVAGEAIVLPGSSKLTKIALNINFSTLPSDSKYTVTLISLKGGSFVSPSFTVP